MPSSQAKETAHQTARWTPAETMATVATATILVALVLGGLTGWLGAHPWWARQTGVAGILIGLLAYAGFRSAGVRRRVIALIALIGTCVSIVSVHEGKRRFVESVAESDISGRFWYFGWYALPAFVSMVLVLVLVRIFRR